MTSDVDTPRILRGKSLETRDTLADGSTFPLATAEAPASKRPETPLEPGQIVDHFRIIRLLGKGGMGAVYLARDIELGRKVALKVIRNKGRVTDEVRKRFVKEARTTAKFNHPHIVTVYAVGELDGLPYVALEYLEGQDLQERITEQDIGLAQALRICMVVADAVAEAHRHGVQHRDLKPANVLLPQDGRIRVVDFGLAHVSRVENINPHDEDLSLHQSNSAAHGTPAYMSPEQWRQSGSSGASDVWAIGLMLHQLCYGRLPYELRNLLRLYRAVTSSDPVPCASSDAVPENVAALIVRCLEKDPDARPTAAQVADTLRDTVLADQRRPAEDESPFRGLRPFVERHAAMFFGRDAEIDACVERLRHEPLMTIVGASGAGKSSLVQAGIIPRLREQGRWLVLRVRPGDKPLDRLARKVLRARTSETGSNPMTMSDNLRGAIDSGSVDFESSVELDDAEVSNMVAELKRSPQQLGMMLRQIAMDRSAKLLLFVDQLEEIFTLEHNPEIEQPYMNAIASAADEAADPVRVLLTMRDDFLGRAGRSGPLVREALRQVVVLTPPDDEMLEKLIVEPVQVLSYDFDDPTLPREMISEVQGTAPLPLLQFAARRLWDERDRERHLLLRRCYDEMGGVTGALVGHADAVLRGFSRDELELARELLLRLVTPERTRRVQSEYQILDGVGTRALDVLNRLTSARLITVQQSRGDASGDAHFELAHESLVVSWPTLSRWIAESREDLVFLAEIEQAAVLWDKRGRREPELWQDDALDEARRRLAKLPTDPSTLVRSFVTASEERQRRSRRRRRALTGVMLAVFAVAAAVSWVLKFEADEQRDDAEAQRMVAYKRGTEALFEAADSAFRRGEMLEARAKLRMAAERGDVADTATRGLWWQLDREPLLWRADIGAQLFDVALSPGQFQVATAALDGAIYLLDVKTKAMRVLRGHRNQVSSVAYSQDGQRLVSSDWDGEVRIWRLGDGQLERTLTIGGGGVRRVSYSSDDRVVLGAVGDGTARLWDAATGSEVGRFVGHNGRVLDAAFSPDGRWVATAGRDGTAALYAVDSRRRVAVLEGHAGDVKTIAFDPRGTRLASGGKDGAVRVWNVSKPSAPKLERVIYARGAAVLVARFSPDGKSLATGDVRGRVMMWDLASGKERMRFESHGDLVTGLVFADSSGRLATTSHDGTVGWWRLDRAPPPAPQGHSAPIYAMAVSPDGRMVASGGGDHSVRLWSVASGEQEQVLTGHQDNVNDMAFGPEGKLLASGGNDRSVQLWNIETGAAVASFHGHGSAVSAVAYSPDGTLVASGSRDKSIALWEVATQTIRRRITGHEGTVDGVAFSPDGETLASVSWDQTVRLWDVSSGNQVRTMRGHERPAIGVAFGPAGDRVVTSSWDGTLRLWDVATGAGRILGKDPGRVYGTSFRVHGDAVLGASSDHHARLWPVDGTGERIIATHANETNTVAFVPSGTLAVTGSDDRTVRTWHVKTSRAYWHAPLLIPGPARLLSHRGLQNLTGAAPIDETLAEAYVEIARQLDSGSASSEGDIVCGLGHKGQLLSWKSSKPESVGSRPASGARDVIATPQGCLLREPNRVVLVPEVSRRAGDRIIYQGEKIVAMGWAAERILVVTPSAVQQFDAKAVLLSSVEADSGISAVGLVSIPGQDEATLVIGYANGSVEVWTEGVPRMLLDRVAASRVVQLRAGPAGTIVAGHANGVVGLYDGHDGSRLRHARLHGSVEHLQISRDGDGASTLFAATDLASHLRWDLSVFTRDHCELLRQLWAAVPATWIAGKPVVEAPPKDHACADSSAQSKQQGK